MDEDDDMEGPDSLSFKDIIVSTEVHSTEPIINIIPASPTHQMPASIPTISASVGSNSAPNANVTTIPIHSEPKRKVSIASDPIGDTQRLGYDNHGFEQNPRRKISQTSIHSHSEMGPVRRKSILHSSNNQDGDSIHSHNSYFDTKSNGKPAYGPTALETIYSKLPKQAAENNLEQSWIYALCMRCRVEYHTPSWEPPHWQKVCPYPLCPSYRQFARMLSLIIIGGLIWVTAYVLIGDSAAPGGQVFNLVVLSIAAHFGGWLISLATLPRLLGMLAVGILFQNVGWVSFEDDFKHVTADLRKIALTIILIRAGLEMEPEAFKKVYKTILKLAIIPWTVEFVIIAVMTHFLLGLPWIWAFLLGSILAGVAPAVVVPCLFRFRVKGYGVAKGIPTLIIAVAGIDDALTVALFGIISSIMFSSSNLAYQISQAPVCILGGLAFGVVWGYVAKIIPEKGDSYVIPIRTIMLFAGGLFAIFGSETVGYEGAGPLAAVFAAFISNYFWCKQGWEIEDNPVATAFEIFWMIFEPILFGVTGTTLQFDKLQGEIVSVGIGCIAAAAIARVLCTAGIAFGDSLNLKEKVFVALSWMAKATVQAALGPVPLKHVKPDSEEYQYAISVQTVAVLSIILTAPLGAILISLSGTKLLTKTKQPQVLEGWRRSHRPSLRDISIIDEEEEREDPELVDDKTTIENTNSNANLSSPTYSHGK